MIAFLLAAVLQATPADPPGASQTTSEPERPNAPATPAENLAALEKLYDQTCTQRAYAAYDDLCEGLRDRIKAYRLEVVRAPKP